LVGTAAWAQDEKPIDWKTGGKWSHLSRYIGTYDYASVLEDKAVKSQLDSMLKGQDINLKSEMEVSAPIGFENDCLILKGNQYHKGNEHQTYMQVCLYEGNINLAVMKKGTITVFSRANEYMYLTDGMKTWIYFQNHSTDLQTKPDNVQFIVQAP
jgi:hypothetical protein